ncbi:type I restriction-modification system subunit M [Lacticaseibacillus nasuensis]|uniref:site-specific DNA-methyltransferase (adenine-specific) n=1 Tax=Lacticaseibacillus nasuensis JCM 17158 TaxID=1291734 RepID=A0A0R1JT49_9LACO|nr:type I restriction-modification system subunit M [Lacticaseibacillus nasuensis]KRK74268.1 Type I restriction-modification system methyltransferase subunit [Lacticaseibacillus nasuensis JCM 17158]
MMTSQEQSQITQELQSKIWAAANALRNSGMEANDYRDYTLGLIFYKYESDRFLRKISEGLGIEFTNLDNAQEAYEEALKDPDAKDVVDVVKSDLRFMIAPDKTFHHLVQDVNHNTFQMADLAQALQDLEDSDEVFSGLFDDLDLNATKLGSSEQERNTTIGDVMSALEQINFAEDTGMDIMGNAYEYLISQFQTESAKKAGEFYTPQAVSRLMMQIGMKGRESVQGVSVYDPAMGSGSLLLNAKRYNSHPDSIQYFGQDVKTAPYNLARMNMMLHDVPTANQHLNLGNTLGADWPSDEPTTFDIVTMNPPYSLSWKPTKAMETDPRFQPFGVAPKSAADYAFLTHGLYHLKSNGTMAIVLATGVLFRGAAEGRIRKALLTKGNISAVIGMPANIFHNTSIPTVVIVLKKQRDGNDVLFIDASKEFRKAKNQNEMDPKNTQKILDTLNARKPVTYNEDGTEFSHLITLEKIAENDYNMNIPMYVDTFIPEPPVNVNQLVDDVTKAQEEITQQNKKLNKLFSQFVGQDKAKQTEIEKIRGLFK